MNQHNLLIAMYNYTAGSKGMIPLPPHEYMKPPLDTSRYADEVMFNQLYDAPSGTFVAHGMLEAHMENAEAYFCPGASTAPTLKQHVAAFRSRAASVFSNYFYRLKDEAERGTLEDMGNNSAGDRASALFLDVNQLGPGGFINYNHGGFVINIAHRDGHVEKRRDPNRKVFTIQSEDYAGFPSSFSKIGAKADRMLIEADEP
jgi:hypothetical protein